jgi:hypothetical protein
MRHLLCPLETDLSKFQLLRLAISEEPNRVGVSLFSPEDGNESSFRNAMFSDYLEFWTIDKAQEPTDSEHGFHNNISSLENKTLH